MRRARGGPAGRRRGPRRAGTPASAADSATPASPTSSAPTRACRSWSRSRPTPTVDTDNVAVTIDGTTAPATAVPADTTTSVRRTAVLVMDTSNSMRGERIEAAQAAAHTFLDTVPDDVYVGIVTFDSDVTPALEPDPGPRRGARRRRPTSSSSQQTRLYDGVQAGHRHGRHRGPAAAAGALRRRRHQRHRRSTDVTAAVADAEVLVNVVALEQDQPAAVAALEELAAAGEGAVINADSEALEPAFSAAGRRARPAGPGHRAGARLGHRDRGDGRGHARAPTSAT